MLVLREDTSAPSGAKRDSTGGTTSIARLGTSLSLVILGSTLSIRKDPSKRQPHQRDTGPQSCVAGMQAIGSTTRIAGLHLESFHPVQNR